MAAGKYKPSSGEDVYIKDKKISEDDYHNLAAFFGEEETDPAFWNAVLHMVAGSEDTQVRKVILAIVLDGAATHVNHRENTEIYLRARLLIHDMKRQTGHATPSWGREKLRLTLWHGLHSTQLLIVLALVGIIFCFGFYVYYEFFTPRVEGIHYRSGHGPRFFRWPFPR